MKGSPRSMGYLFRCFGTYAIIKAALCKWTACMHCCVCACRTLSVTLSARRTIGPLSANINKWLTVGGSACQRSNNSRTVGHKWSLSKHNSSWHHSLDRDSVCPPQCQVCVLFLCWYNVCVCIWHCGCIVHTGNAERSLACLRPDIPFLFTSAEVFVCSPRYQIQQPAALNQGWSVAEEIGNIVFTSHGLLFLLHSFIHSSPLGVWLRKVLSHACWEKMENNDSCFAKDLQVHIHLETLQSEVFSHLSYCPTKSFTLTDCLSAFFFFF